MSFNDAMYWPSGLSCHTQSANGHYTMARSPRADQSILVTLFKANFSVVLLSSIVYRSCRSMSSLKQLPVEIAVRVAALFVSYVSSRAVVKQLFLPTCVVYPLTLLFNKHNQLGIDRVFRKLRKLSRNNFRIQAFKLETVRIQQRIEEHKNQIEEHENQIEELLGSTVEAPNAKRVRSEGNNNED